MCFGEERQPIRSYVLCSCGTIVHHALVDLLDAFFCLSLLRQCPATHDRTDCHPEWKTLCRGKAHGGFGTFLGETLLTTELMEDGRTTQGKTQAKGMRTLPCQGYRLVVPR